jgi:ABC-2 type transport system permease protein
MLVVSTVTMVAVTMAMTALALGLGAVFPNFETENAAEVPMSFGGLLFMMVAVTYLAAVVILEAFPVYEYLFLRHQRGVDPGVDSLIRGFGGAAVLTILVIVLSLRSGVKKVGAADF